MIIYSGCTSPDSSKWKEEHILRRHTMVVVGIDWCKSKERIVTCSHDVNAFVWTYDPRKNRWEPKLSILRVDRAALRCKWSPDGTKFAVASASKVVSVCYYQGNQDWWVSKLTKRGQHRSTVLDVAWHPCSQVFASACCDFKCRIFSAFIPEIDQPVATSSTPFGNLEQMKFGQMITEFESTGAWIEAVAWSPSGNKLVFSGHDSTISFVSFETGTPVVTPIKTMSLPYIRLMFLNENVVVAAGHGFEPELYKGKSSTWDALGSADKKSGGSAVTEGKKKGGFLSNVNMFEKRVKQGTDEGSGTDAIRTIHHNAITDMIDYKDGFTTTGRDGMLVFWSKSTLNENVKGLGL